MSSGGIKINIPARTVTDAQIVGYTLVIVLVSVLLTTFLLLRTEVLRMQTTQAEQNELLLDSIDLLKYYRDFVPHVHDRFAEQHRMLNTIFFEGRFRPPEHTPATDAYREFIRNRNLPEIATERR